MGDVERVGLPMGKGWGFKLVMGGKGWGFKYAEKCTLVC